MQNIRKSAKECDYVSSLLSKPKQVFKLSDDMPSIPEEYKNHEVPEELTKKFQDLKLEKESWNYANDNSNLTLLNSMDYSASSSTDSSMQSILSSSTSRDEFIAEEKRYRSRSYSI